MRVVSSNHPRAAGLVVDGQHLRRVGKHFPHLAHDAVRGDDRHIALEAVIVAFVNGENLRLVGTAGPDDLGRQRLIEIFLLEIEHGLQAMPLARIFKQCSLFQAETVHRILQVLVLLANVAQVDIVLPETEDAGLRVLHHAFDGRNHGVGPQADEPYTGAVRRVERSPSGICAPNLHRQSNHLDQQQNQQHQQVAIADEEGFHEGPVIVSVVSDQWSRVKTQFRESELLILNR